MTVITYAPYGEAVENLKNNNGLTERGAISVLEIALAHDLRLQELENRSLTALIENYLTTPETPEAA